MSEDAPNPAAAPPARLIPEGVKCVGCDYDLRGLTVDRVCPECGKPIGETVIVDVDELRNTAWIESVMVKVSIFIGLNLLSAATFLGFILGPIILISASICVAMLARTLRQGPSQRESRIARWPEAHAWAVSILVIVGVVVLMNMTLWVFAGLAILMAAIMLNQTAFFAVYSEATQAIRSCPRVVLTDRIALGLRLMVLGYMLAEGLVLLLLRYGNADGLLLLFLGTAIVISICLSVMFTFICSRAIGRQREQLMKIILASCAYHGEAADDVRRRSVRQLRFSWHGPARRR